jgi:hypothetical protein
MKYLGLGLAFLITNLASTATAGDLAGLLKQKEREVALDRVYIPATGFDDNDRVEAVLVGNLPSPCFTLDRAVAEPSKDGKSFRVRQMAWRWNSGACATGDLIEDPVPFVTPVLLGTLAANSYQVEYLQTGGDPARVSFQVERAKSVEIDNFNYASIRAVEIADTTEVGRPLVAKVAGMLPSRCGDLDGEPKVEALKDVVMVYPRVKTGSSCLTTPRGFEREVNLGALKPGNYLLHVRSRGGNAVYQSFQVTPANR